ncbi:uncharacterized protein LOC144918190 [Branchiostoma floridae x Branchiostoma belcheri]
MIRKSGLDDILSCFRLIECQPDHLQFQNPVDVTVLNTRVPQSHNFILFGQETSTVAEGTWKDLSEECLVKRSASNVLFKLQHFSIYILVAIISSVALSSSSKRLLDCLNGKSFPCSFTPYLGKISGKKHPLTIVCKEGYNASTSTPRMYQRFGLARTSEFNIFDEERLSVEITHLALVKRCADTYQINRATCKTEEGQAMDLIVEPEKEEAILTGQAVISVSRFLGASVRKICTLNLTPQSVGPDHLVTGNIVPVSVEEVGAMPSMTIEAAEMQFAAPADHPSMKETNAGIRKYFYFIKEKVSYKWKDLAFFLDLDEFDDATLENVAGRNRDDKSRCMDMLNHWHQRRGDDATIDILLECLSKAGLQDVADGLKTNFPELAKMEKAKSDDSLSESKEVAQMEQ